MKDQYLLGVWNNEIRKLISKCESKHDDVVELMTKNKPRRISAELMPKFKIDGVKK